MFDGDTGALLPDQREGLASTVENLDEILAGERVLSADWIGDEPSAQLALSAGDLARQIRAGEFKQGVAYRVSWHGAA
jgi:hypothetical protein